jgi:hypothetical protein
MSLVQLDPRASDRPILPTAGLYGEGKNGFDVELTRFEHPAEDRLPPWDQDGENGPYTYYGFQCKSREDHSIVFYDHWEEAGAGTGSRTAKWLLQVGVEMTEDLQFDPDSVEGRPVIIEVADPKKREDGRKFSGRLKNIIGA